VQLEENNGITKLTYNVQANVGGKIAQIGSRLIDMTAKKMADIFFGRFSELLSSVETKKDLKTILKNRFDFNQIYKKWVYAVITVVVIITIYIAKNFF
jgi:hypothetical protein